MACETAEFDGSRWQPLPAGPGAEPEGSGGWSFRRLGRRHLRDKSFGNFLWGPSPDGKGVRPRFYVKEVFFPLFLCADAARERFWLSTFTGLVRLDVAE
jgi:hypothetical protein